MKKRMLPVILAVVMYVLMPKMAQADGIFSADNHGFLTAAAVSEPAKVAVPAGKVLTYNGSSQRGVPVSDLYSITGNAAKKAGVYKARLSLKDKTNYRWADGTTTDKAVSWRINQKKITPAVSLSKTSYTFNGKSKKPGVLVKDGSMKLAVSDYQVTYKKNKSVGKAFVYVKLRGNYSGSRTVTFRINPKGTSLKSLKGGSRAITVKWAKQSRKMISSRITGYQIMLATDKEFTKNTKKVNVSGYKKVSRKVTGLKKNTKYFVRIRTYKKFGGVRYFSQWSKIRSMKTE